jgi:phosphoglycolate phosphatase-like HAD superfamily hydrolase
VKELLEWCRSRGIHTAIVSGEIAEVLAARCESLSLHSLINHIQGGVSKKEVALKKTLRHFNLLPQHAVYVDDTYDGLSSALRVGTLTVGFTNGYGSFEKIRAANPHFPNERFPRINDFHVVRQVIELHTENRTRAS